MCDYSLHNVASRPAKVGDRLVVTEFNGSITRAVCLRPGTELAFDHEVAYGPTFGLFPPRLGYMTLRQRVARFRQLETHRIHVHHDALEFPNGEIILVTRLREGLQAKVLQLPADAESTTPQEAQEMRAKAVNSMA